MKKLVPFLALSVLAACSSDNDSVPADALMHNDFEQLTGWVADASTITKEHAHSGSHALKVDAAHEFSLTYVSPLSEITTRKPRGVKFEAWAYLDSPQGNLGKLALVVSPPGDGQANTLGDGIELSEVKEYKKWVKISKEIVFPATVQPEHLLKVFLWRAGSSESIYIDDITITALD